MNTRRNQKKLAAKNVPVPELLPGKVQRMGMQAPEQTKDFFEGAWLRKKYPLRGSERKKLALQKGKRL